ncbi:hypothetical protein CJF31_00003603 [Rutstroemia sp. NJR-2017a BVV2]|nr:hypothetical protein CJF31_00003603 [Rutstroemia sp. NJR-2017a BVV2]
MEHLDPHEAPPEYLKQVFKRYKNMDIRNIDADESIVDFRRMGASGLGNVSKGLRDEVFLNYLCKRGKVPLGQSKPPGDGRTSKSSLEEDAFDPGILPGRSEQFSMYKSTSLCVSMECPFPLLEIIAVAILLLAWLPSTVYSGTLSDYELGLVIIPSLIPVEVQAELVDEVLYEELPNPSHKTNLHAHYRVDFKDWQNSSPEAIIATPIDPTVHKPLTLSQVMIKKLRWITLGGQYDWTKKIYPEEEPPEFPNDMKWLIGQLFPEMEPEAAIVNFYSPGDTLSLHRDVSEEVDRGLVSISIGCDCIFIIGLNKSDTGKDHIVVRLRSGDALYMTGESRFAWHGVPKIIPDTCPPDLFEAVGKSCKKVPLPMANKRINLNVRQMRERRGNA